MNAKTLYTRIYKMLDDVTPIKADCGKLCDAACCKGDEDSGMYLFPFEEVMFSGDTWYDIYDSDFIFRGSPVKIFICKDSCPREKRPLSCRIFPLFYVDGEVKGDIRGKGLCPLITGQFPLEQYNPEFIVAVKKVFNILNKFRTTKLYIKETEKIIDEFCEVNDIFK